MLNIVYDVENELNPNIMRRVAEIDGRYYPFVFDMRQGQIYDGNEFARHNRAGVLAICRGYNTRTEAINSFGGVSDDTTD